VPDPAGADLAVRADGGARDRRSSAPGQRRDQRAARGRRVRGARNHGDPRRPDAPGHARAAPRPRAALGLRHLRAAARARQQRDRRPVVRWRRPHAAHGPAHAARARAHRVRGRGVAWGLRADRRRRRAGHVARGGRWCAAGVASGAGRHAGRPVAGAAVPAAGRRGAGRRPRRGRGAPGPRRAAGRGRHRAGGRARGCAGLRRRPARPTSARRDG
jgi:hypothetical protein